jgi:DNA-binding NarL/FixJ family response regulator
MQVKVCAERARPASALPISRPGAVFARDESAGPRARSVTAERILLIEDDFLVATQIEAALIDAGFAMAGVGSSADEAIELASSQQPALCVMDIRLAGSRDGIEAAIEIFMAHGIRCIFATAHADPEARTRAEKAVPLGWLQKPFTMRSLITAVRGAVGELQGRN